MTSYIRFSTYINIPCSTQYVHTLDHTCSGLLLLLFFVVVFVVCFMCVFLCVFLCFFGGVIFSLYELHCWQASHKCAEYDIELLTHDARSRDRPQTGGVSFVERV